MSSQVIVSKITRDHLPSKMNLCKECEGPRSILCEVIVYTRFGQYIITLKATVIGTFDGVISKSIGVICTQNKCICQM